ncbi:Protein FAM78A [Bagarius yarrelli]|uniref:Protein FAM78A n=1 Tax=Bagarius yarrelli TaxID=175774 RepID=A0A556V3A0_BAGYA|nr:Protein FAM78A [Bagarius yarrelli]
MGCMQSAGRTFSESVKVLELNTSIDSNPTVIDESSNVVLRYRTPYFRASALVQVPPVVRKEIWTVGWIQACKKMDFFNYYGEEGMSSWELPDLRDGHIHAISDSDGVNYPWYGCTSEIYTIVGPTKKSTTLTVSMNDNFCPSITWSIPTGTTSVPPLLSFIQRDQHFTTWLVVMNQASAEMVPLRTIRWGMQLAIQVDPKKPLGQRARLMDQHAQEQPEILTLNEPIPPNALYKPNANDAQTYRRLQKNKTELHKLKMAVGEFYMSLAFLQSYQELNYQGFYKITKKYDAKIPSDRGLQWRTDKLERSLLHTEKGICEEMMMRLEWKVLTAPLWPVGFADCWLADQLNSLSPLILSLWDLMCFYIFQINWAGLQDGGSLVRENMVDMESQSKVIICLIQCFPPWLRFAQCLRHFWDSGNTVHLLNAGKYSTVFLMVTFAEKSDPAVEESVHVYLYLWAASTCVSVIVTVSWDLRMDWGLLQGNGLLKEELLFSHEVYYYAAMLADVLLRISWAINILLAQMKDSTAIVTASAILAPLEVLRRSIWNFFRLENEHLKNCRASRAIRDFDLPASPINLPQQILTDKLKDPIEQIIVQQETRTSHHKPAYLLLKYLR